VIHTCRMVSGDAVMPLSRWRLDSREDYRGNYQSLEGSLAEVVLFFFRDCSIHLRGCAVRTMVQTGRSPAPASWLASCVISACAILHTITPNLSVASSASEKVSD
jgi:hypothetical protein